MITKIIEATQDKSQGFNWGKFLLGKFDHEWEYTSALDKGRPLLSARGWDTRNILIVDLQTGKGAIFSPHGLASADLKKHAIWVCPMYEPFLEWLYKQDLSDIAKLPDLVEIPNAPGAMSGYRRPGPEKKNAKRTNAATD
jgi:hypothetical protein